MENRIFSYIYSAAMNREIEEIRRKYLPKEENKLALLKALDRKVQASGIFASIVIGVIGVLIFGIGLCIGLGAIGGSMTVSVVLGIIGIVTMLPAYPVYCIRAKHAKEKYGPQILRLAEELGVGRCEKTISDESRD